MIVCTRTIDTICRKAFGGNNVAISTVENIIDKFALDPTLTQPCKEAFIIANTDLKNPKVKSIFLELVADKHPGVRIIYFVKSGKSDIEEGNGIDLVINKVTPKELESAVYSLIESISKKPDVVSASNKVDDSIEALVPKELNGTIFTSEIEEENLEIEEEKIEIVEKIEIEEEVEDEIANTEQVYTFGKSDFANRIKQCCQVSDIVQLTKQLNAETIMQDIMKDNGQYIHIEDRLKVIHEKIFEVFIDKKIPTIEEKLDKIKSLLLDKDYYRSKNNSVVEQRIEEIIKTVTGKTRELLSERLGTLDSAIERIALRPTDSVDFARIVGLTEERSELMLELQVLDQEVKDIFHKIKNVGTDIATFFADEAVNLTGSPLADAHLRIRGEAVISPKSLDAIVHTLYTCDQTTKEFKEAVQHLSKTQKKLNKLIDLDNETIIALSQIVMFLRANKIEDTIIAKSLLKKSLRLFVALEGAGRTVVPYTLSKLKARENVNVLYVDLTGTTKLEEYGDQSISLESWMTSGTKKEFLAVAGDITTEGDITDKLLQTLVKAAEFYRVINIVVDPSQEELIAKLASDVLVVNYIIEPTQKSLKFFKGFIEHTSYNNVAQRVIINKCDVPVQEIIKLLGLWKSLDVHITKIPYIPQFVDCALNRVRPYELQAVKEALLEVREIC